MRVLWFTNTPSCYSQNPNGYNGGGWISSLEKELGKIPEIELGVCFYSRSVTEAKKEESGGTVYYLLPRPHKSVKYTIETIFGRPGTSTFRHERLAMPALVNVAEDFKPDIIQVFGSENIYGLIANHVSVPVVLHIQGILSACLNAFLPPFVSWKMYLWQDKSFGNILRRLSDKIAWQRNSVTEQRMFRSLRYYMGHSVWDERIVKLISPDSCYFHCNEMLREVFYDKSAKRTLPDKPVFVTTISSPLYKGFDLVLKTAAILKKVLPDFEWKVFGDVNPKFVETVFRIKHHDVGIKLMGVGTAEQIRSALISATAYVHPSYIENASNSLCEASISGVTGISVNVGGIPAVIDDGRTGFLVPANDPFQMAYLMKYIYENPEINIAAGNAARKEALVRHDRQTIVCRVLEIYNEILENDSK